MADAVLLGTTERVRRGARVLAYAVKRREQTTIKSQLAIQPCLRGSSKPGDLYVSRATRAERLIVRSRSWASSSVSPCSSTLVLVKNISCDHMDDFRGVGETSETPSPMDEASSPTDINGVGGDGVDTDGSFLVGETRAGARAMLPTDETGRDGARASADDERANEVADAGIDKNTHTGRGLRVRWRQRRVRPMLSLPKVGWVVH